MKAKYLGFATVLLFTNLLLGCSTTNVCGYRDDVCHQRRACDDHRVCSRVLHNGCDKCENNACQSCNISYQYVCCDKRDYWME